MAKGHDEIAGEITIAWIQAMAQLGALPDASLTTINNTKEQISASDVAAFYERIYKQISA